jgi:HPt (histidine-containing phosphotransfer) domain-containing protein
MDDYIAKPILRSKVYDVFKKYLPYQEVISQESPSHEEESFDLEALSDVLGFEPDEVVEMLQELVDIANTELSVMREAMAQGDSIRLYKAAHNIKGGAFSMRMTAIGTTSESIESAGRQNDFTSMEAMLDELEALVKELSSKVNDESS